MSRWGPAPFDSDDALDFVGYLEELDDPEGKLHEVLEAILAEDECLYPPVMEIGLAAATVVARRLDDGRALEPERSLACPDIVLTDRLRLMALAVMERAIQPHDRRTGPNLFYGERESLGEAEEYRQGLEPYLRILAAGARTSIDEPRDLGYSWPCRKEWTPSPAEIGLMRQRLLSLAPAFQAFPPHVFGESAPGEPYTDSPDFSEEILQIIAGACVHRSGVLIENLRYDLDVLGETGGTVADIGPNRFRELTELPWKFASSYDEEFVRRLLESAISATTRLLQPGRLKPRTIAEYRAVFSVTASLSDLASRYGGLDEGEEQLVHARVSRAFSYATSGFSDLSLHFAPSITTLSRITPLLGTAWLEVFKNPWVVPPEKWFLPFPGDLKRPGRRTRGPSGNRQR